MIFYIKKFLGLCNHRWITKDIVNNIDTQMSKRYGKDVIVGQIYYLQCEVCGNVKKKIL